MAEIMKKCCRCGIAQGLENFQKHPRGKHGRTTICNKCKNAYQLAKYHARPEVVAQRKYKAGPEYAAHKLEVKRAARRRRAAMLREQGHEGVLAHDAERLQVLGERGKSPEGKFRRAVQRLAAAAEELGYIERPPVCDGCEKLVPLQRHHEDYSLPLDVEWMCASCHGKRHYKLSQEGWTGLPTGILSESDN